MIQPVCTGFVVGKRPDGTRIVSSPPIAAMIRSMPYRRRHRPAIVGSRNGHREWTDIARGRQRVIRITQFHAQMGETVAIIKWRRPCASFS
jgi:hypothetical protein